MGDNLADLLGRCAAGDGGAFRRLYELRSARLYGIALRITQQSALAADAVHDALLQVWRNAVRFDPARGSADAWLTGLVRYRALDIAHSRRREVVSAQPSDQVDDTPDTLTRLAALQEGAALHRCLTELPSDRRTLVAMAFMNGLTHAEVANRMQQPLGTVKSTIRRALIALRNCLERPDAAR